MSTYWYMECMSHNPPVRSLEEFTQHTEDARYWNVVALLGERPLRGEMGYHGDSMENQAELFIRQHPHCCIEFVNEYNDRRQPEAGKRGPYLNLEIVNGWLIDRGDGGIEDAEPLIDLKNLPGWPGTNQREEA